VLIKNDRHLKINIKNENLILNEMLDLVEFRINVKNYLMIMVLIEEINKVYLNEKII